MKKIPSVRHGKLLTVMLFGIALSLLGFAACKKSESAIATFSLSEDKVSLAIYDGPDGKYNELGHFTAKTLTVAAKQGGNTVSDAAITWSSDNIDVATVENGVVRAVSLGTATITAEWTESKNLVYSRSCEVKVYVPVVEYPYKSADVFLSSEDGNTEISLKNDLDIDKTGLTLALRDVTDRENIFTINYEVSGDNEILQKSNLTWGARTVEAWQDGLVIFRFKLHVITKVITSPEQLITIEALTEKLDNGTWKETGDPCFKTQGYFVLGNNIDLTGKTVKTSFFYEHGQTAKPWGFNGRFDGRGYTVYGGTYGIGGLFGAVGSDGVILNTAFVNVTLYDSEAAGVKVPVVIGGMFHGTINNILIDVVSAAGSSHAVARAMGNSVITDCVVYYPAASTMGTYTYYAFNTYLLECYPKEPEAQGVNLYSIGGIGNDGGTSCYVPPASFPILSRGFLTKNYAFGTKCPSIKFDLDTSANGCWDLSGDKAMFKTSVEFIDNLFDETLAGINLVPTGGSIDLPNLPNVTYRLAASDAGYAEINNNKLAVSSVVPSGYGITVTAVWNGRTETAYSFTVEVIEQRIYELYTGLNAVNQRQQNANGFEIDLSGELSGDIPSGSTWKLKDKNGVEKPVNPTKINGKALTLSMVGIDAGEYTLTGTADLFNIAIPVIVVNKIIKTAEDLQNLKYYGEISDYTASVGSGVWAGPQYRLNGYYVLGNNIDLDNIEITTPFFGTHGTALNSWGFNGTFDGRGYTVYGGTYKIGGLFGCVAGDSVVKNTAFINVTLSGDYAAVMARVFHGTLSNILIEVTSVVGVSGSEAYAVARTIAEAKLENCFVYYPVRGENSAAFPGTYSYWFFENPAEHYLLPVTGANIYSVGGNGGEIGATVYMSAYFARNKFVFGTTCADILLADSGAFDGFNSFMWDFDGDRARFLSSANIVIKKVAETKSYELYTGLDNGGQRQANSAGMTIDLTGEMGADIIPSSGLTWTLNAKNNPGAAVDVGGCLSLTANGKGILLSAISGLGIYGGEYVLTGKSDDGLFKLEIPILLINKIITSAEDLLNIKAYGDITDYTASVGAGDWAGPQYKLNGCFVLGGNIDLTGEVVATDFYGTHGLAAKPYGFTGIFDGRGYTVYGGTYKQGGLFGSVAGGAEVKNTAFIDVTLDGNYASVIGRMFHGRLLNILIDVVSVTGVSGNEHYAIARTIAEAKLESCFVYYPVRTNETNSPGTYGYYLFGGHIEPSTSYTLNTTGTNIYSVGGNGGEIGSTNYVTFVRNKFAFGTPCGDILAANANAFGGFDLTMWNFDGAKARFNSKTDI